MKTIFTFLALFMLQLSLVQAQGWERLIDVYQWEVVHDIVPTPDGGSIITGKATQVIGSFGDDRILLTKVDPQGRKEWSTLLDLTVGDDEAFSILTTPGGGYLLAGRATDGNSWESRKFLLEVDAQGLERSRTTLRYGLGDGFWDVLATPDGNYAALGWHHTERDFDTRRTDISKFTPAGNLLWSLNYGDSTNYATVMKVMDDGHLVTAISVASDSINGYRNLTLLKVNSNDGTIIWEKTRVTAQDEQFFYFDKTLDGGLIALSRRGLGNSVFTYELIKFDSEGNEEWVKQYTYDGIDFEGLYQTNNGDYVALGRYDTDVGAEGALARFDSSGNERWQKRFLPNGNFSTYNALLRALYEQPNGGFIIVGMFNQPSPGDIYLIRTDSLGTSFSNVISGNVYADTNADCLRQPNESGQPGWIISLEGNSPQVLTTDSLGNYHFSVDTGQYTLRLSAPNFYWATCPGEQNINLPAFADTAIIDFATAIIENCPLLTVDIGTPFLRRCFDNTYYVNYCNRGTATAEAPYIEIEFDEFLSVDSATLPFTNNGQLYRFDLDSLPTNECGDFRVYVQLDCDSTVLGQTHCVEAHIYPDSICQPAANWSGASVEVDALCEGDSVRMNIRNVGTGNMQMALPYIVIEDEVILRSDNFLLPPDSVLSITEPANGSTFRLEAEQEPNHPGNSQPSVTLEGCGGLPFSLGFVGQYPQDDGNPFIDINCTANRGAYDPNDKQGFPLGYGNQNYIKANQDIEYLIRFQNTGTDTAFRVIIRDTIAATLDITSIRPAASSHPYSFQLYGDNIVQFTFDNIMLPDSFVNEPASNGFVKFHIAQQPDLPNGTVIENSAAIYFDFNAPIITNISWHTIGENFVLVNTSPEPERAAVSIKAYPNPFSDETNFELVGLEGGSHWFELYDLQGRRLRQQAFDGPAFTFRREGLPAGVYPYVFRDAAGGIGTGKLIIQ